MKTARWQVINRWKVDQVPERVRKLPQIHYGKYTRMVFSFSCVCVEHAVIYIYTPTVLRWWLTAIIQNRHTKEVLLGTNLNTIFMVRYYLTVALFVLKKYI